MSTREKMLKSAINSMMEDYDESIQRMSTMAKMDDTPFIQKEKNPFSYITCYMCGSKECEEIRYGNQKYNQIHIMDLCKDCQKIMAKFLNNNGGKDDVG